MPNYDYKCPNCGNEVEMFLHMSELNLPVNCGKCNGAEMKRQIGPANIREDYKPYLDENMTHEPIYVKSRQHRRELMKQHKLVELG
tara:strand:- start:231 stop:488 length:258 start_codon:yes stop_codon:yes gene_type:complete